jgi:hypothetical protein
VYRVHDGGESGDEAVVKRHSELMWLRAPGCITIASVMIIAAPPLARSP